MSGEEAHLYGVIMAGGSGTRLWPLSTRDHPKQFLSIGTDRSLIAQTAARLEGLIPPSKLFVVCGQNHAEKLDGKVPGVTSEQIWVEPQAKNTGPALIWAAMKLRQRDPKALMAVFPADHLILPSEWDQFSQDLKLGVQIARQEGALVTFGIPPKHPSTGFGYLERGERRTIQGDDYFSVQAFHEKPDQSTANSYLEDGGYFWNSGIFVWEVATFLDQWKKYQPAMFAAFEELAGQIGQNNYSKKLHETFRKVENISVDYAVMEKAERVFMVPARFGWDDVGNLMAFAKVLVPDGDQNITQGEVFCLEATGNVVVAQSKPVALIGTKDLMVVASEKAILILPKDRAQDVKKMVDYLKELGREDLL